MRETVFSGLLLPSFHTRSGVLGSPLDRLEFPKDSWVCGGSQPDPRPAASSGLAPLRSEPRILALKHAPAVAGTVRAHCTGGAVGAEVGHEVGWWAAEMGRGAGKHDLADSFGEKLLGEAVELEAGEGVGAAVTRGRPAVTGQVTVWSYKGRGTGPGAQDPGQTSHR